MNKNVLKFAGGFVAGMAVLILLKTAPTLVMDARGTVTQISNKELAERGEQAAHLANPMTKMDSVEEVNAAVGCHLVALEGERISADNCWMIEGEPLVGEYDFALLHVGEVPKGETPPLPASFTLRASATEADISGIWEDGKTLTDKANEAGVDYFELENGFWARWFVGEMQYNLSCTDASQEEFDEQLEFFREAVQG